MVTEMQIFKYPGQTVLDCPTLNKSIPTALWSLLDNNLDMSFLEILRSDISLKLVACEGASIFGIKVKIH